MPAQLASAKIVAEAGQVVMTGAVTSRTVTVATHTDVLGVGVAASVTVSVTVLSPRFAQVKVVGGIDRFAIPQLSEEPPSTSAALIVTETVPEAGRSTVMFLQTATGA